MKHLHGLLIALLLILASSAQAELKLSTTFGSHMVLQQEMPIRIWGWADPGENVSVELAGDRGGVGVGTRAGDDGKWMVELEAIKADNKPMTLTVTSGDKTIELTDILMGEVWICSGQSNMEWSVARSLNPDEEIAAADHPTIRLFNVPGHVKQNEPQDDSRGQWQLCSPESIPNFTAVGYFFGRALSKELDVPIGLVGTNWGGTRIEPWTPPVGFDLVPQLTDYVDELKQGKYKGGATQIYNGMVAGLTPLSVRGAIWYQGESNAGDGLRYEYLKEALVKGWRSTFDNDELSFYWVQLADFRQPDENPAGGGWGPVREGQRRALKLDNTGMAVIIDIGAANDIHPKNKQDVGHRLALWALANDYDKDIVYSGPLYKSHTTQGNKITVSFDHVGGGLIVADKAGLEPTKEIAGGELAEFAIRDKAGNWHWAKASIDGDTVVVWADGVAEPTAVRYGYQSNPANANLYNKAGLPASPFTTVD